MHHNTTLFIQSHLCGLRPFFLYPCVILSVLLSLTGWSSLQAAVPVQPTLQSPEPLLDPQIREIVQTAVENTGIQLRETGPVIPAASPTFTATAAASSAITVTASQSGFDTVSETVSTDVNGTNASINPRLLTGPIRPSFGGDVTLTQHAADGVSVRTPATWQVDSSGPNTILTLSVPDVNFLGAVQRAPTAPLPQAMAHVLLRNEAATVLATFDPAAAVLSLNAFWTEQQLLVTKVGFTATFEGDDAAGAVYIVSPGATSYLFLALAPQTRWRELEATVDAVVQSMIFEEELLTWREAAVAPVRLTTAAENFGLQAPPGWLFTDTADDSNWQAVLIAPGRQMAGALQLIAETPNDSQLDALFTGELSSTSLPDTDGLRTELSTLLGVTLDKLNEEIRQTLVHADDAADEGVPVARLSGQVAWNDVTVDAVLYLYPVDGTYVALLLLGDSRLIPQHEDDLLAAFDSLAAIPAPPE